MCLGIWTRAQTKSQMRRTGREAPMEKAHVGGGIHPENGAQVVAVERLTLGKYKTMKLPNSRSTDTGWGEDGVFSRASCQRR